MLFQLLGQVLQYQTGSQGYGRRKLHGSIGTAKTAQLQIVSVVPREHLSRTSAEEQREADGVRSSSRRWPNERTAQEAGCDWTIFGKFVQITLKASFLTIFIL